MTKDIKIVKKSYRNDDSYHANHLYVQISGKDINYAIINTIKRVISNNIPSYAFTPDNIIITKNTSIYNNDRLRNRLEMFPIPNIENKLDFEEYDRLRKYTRGKKSYTEETVEENKDNIENMSVLNMYLKCKNTDFDILDVTTEHCEFYNKGKKIKSIYGKVAKILELKKGEEIELSAIVDRGVPLNHARHMSCSQCVANEIDPNTFLFKLEGTGQLTEKEIYVRSIRIILYILEKLKRELVGIKYDSKRHGKITLEDYDHTVGNLLSHEMQKHKNIKFAAYKMDHLLIRKVTIQYVIDGKKTINDILEASMNNLVVLYKKLLVKFESLKI